MENYPYSYPDSHDSSPRSLNNESWDDQQPAASQKVKFMISYNGKILPRPHDNQLTYVGGETKILALDRTIRFSAIVSKLSSFTSDEITFKYQLPGEDLDALISVTNDEDLEHMMAEYDRLHRSSGSGGSKPARLRLFLFPVSNSNQSSFSGDDPKPNQQWFVDALNAVPVSVPPIDASSPPASASNPSDLLFGFEKQPVSSPSPSPVPVSVPVSAKQDVEGKVAVGSDSGSERGGGGDPMYEMHRQIQDLQRLQIQEQKQQQQQLQQQLQQAAMFQRSNEGNINLARANYDYYMPEKPAAASVPVTVAPAGYWQDRNTAVSGGYSDQINSIERQQQQQQQVHQQQQQQAHQQQQQQHQLYMISSQGYQTPVTNVRHVTGQVGHTGQGYYGVQMQQRVAQDVYREQPMYAMGPSQVQQQQQQQQHPQMKVMMGEVGGGGGGGGGSGSGGGYTTQVGYDSTGRQVYYTTPSAQAGIGATYQTAVNVDPRQAGQLNQESKVVKPPQAS